ncbi:hypothetical protein IscW_ISCW013189 [Ixodes scapularis]|uniref:Uncharacterized protein n=1 Tax=Ixodes scapularis TaxID=6945 RepID=B7QBB6_IXOSC|nr:hypothetical protein IscW_ISCW013189 [Ixodes scapularis]|eukprot:XP_002412842.1 hypothetical protein IscW_ISCW013189 [Ixodes scapularis]
MRIERRIREDNGPGACTDTLDGDRDVLERSGALLDFETSARSMLNKSLAALVLLVTLSSAYCQAWPTPPSSPTAVLYQPTNLRYPPDRMDPYRFGFTTDRYGRGFGYSCKDVFECQALKEKQELEEGYRGLQPPPRSPYPRQPPLPPPFNPQQALQQQQPLQRLSHQQLSHQARYPPSARLPLPGPYW